jgi:hypothetical protein
MFEFWKDFKISLIVFVLQKYSNLPLNLNSELNSNFLDPKSSVWTQIIIGLEFKILWIKFLNQSSNSHFWRSSSFSLNFKNHSNLFELGQISSQIFKIFIPIQFVHLSQRLLSSSPNQPIQPSRPALLTYHISLRLLFTKTVPKYSAFSSWKCIALKIGFLLVNTPIAQTTFAAFFLGTAARTGTGTSSVAAYGRCACALVASAARN